MEARVAIERHAIRVACERALLIDLDRISDAFDQVAQIMNDLARGGRQTSIFN